MSVEELKQLQKELKSIMQHMEAFSKLNLSKPEAFDEGEGILKRMPPADTLGRALGEWRIKAQSVVDKVKQERKESFGRMLAEFIRMKQDQKIATREFDQAWRVGSLEIQLRRETAQIQIAYNQQIIIKWTAVTRADDIVKHYDVAVKKIDQSLIPMNILIEVFWEAYEYLCFQQARANNAQPAMVPLKLLYAECPASLMRYASRMKKTLPTDLPFWAFLYNLDTYRQQTAVIPMEKRLGLQTGTQSESRNLGIVLNGLDAHQDYRTFCYIYSAEGHHR